MVLASLSKSGDHRNKLLLVNSQVYSSDQLCQSLQDM